MTRLIPNYGTVLLLLLGLFQALAGLGTLIHPFVKDRLPEQFVPVWRSLLNPFYAADPDEGAVRLAAVISQWIIGITEPVAAGLYLAAGVLRKHRLRLTHVACLISTAIFGAFTLVLFSLHDPTLPSWNQYPAVLAWIGVTWVIVRMEMGGTGGAGARDGRSAAKA